MGDCCVRGFQWDAAPKGREGKLAGRDCYITGSNQNAAVMIIHDLFGFGGESIPVEILNDQSRWAELDLPSFLKRNAKDVRAPEIFACAAEMKSNHPRTGIMGFCYGGWGAFQLAAKGLGLVDCVSVAHPTLLEREEMEKVGVPVQILAPEIDPQFTPDLKAFCERCDSYVGPGEKEGMERAKNASVMWFRQWLQ
ncbi:unnamed protein product [Parascedosporium putredinis]|uniref:Dienelactone hydrolase domain-containing protein n=1 Tax=Parascedosporium putredinis TaxID=1442378 RepID=A0A9P1H0G1_9PEZI|nr:unnamed protein product [Parascedosporium putredinis]CAI7993924.1 unnamed protein product [Parascedosporium putredinis]